MKPTVLGDAAAEDEETGLQSGIRAPKAKTAAAVEVGEKPGVQRSRDGRCPTSYITLLLIGVAIVSVVCFFAGRQLGQSEGEQSAGTKQELTSSFLDGPESAPMPDLPEDASGEEGGEGGEDGDGGEAPNPASPGSPEQGAGLEQDASPSSPYSVAGSLASMEWNKSARLGSDAQHQCDYRVTGYDERVQVCLRPYDDLVSEAVRREGQWAECRELLSIWQDPSYLGEPSSNDVFFDIGANIGMCTMQLAVSTQAKEIFAFEPSPSNLFYLTSTFLKNPAFMGRLRLFPIGLGVAAADLPIFAEPGNAGHSVVGKPVGEEARNTPVRVGTVHVRRLDDLFKYPYPRVRLAKIDVEGFETNVLRGGRELFSSGAIRSVYFELSPFLLGQGTTRVELVNLFLEFGFEFKELGGQAMGADRLRSLACNECPHCFANLFAVMAHHSPATAQKPSLSCG